MTAVATLDELESTYVVLRSLDADGKSLRRGDVVDVRAWRNITPLVSDRRIAHIFTPEGRAAVDPEFPMPTVSFGPPEVPSIEVEEIPVVERPRRGRPPKNREVV